LQIAHAAEPLRPCSCPCSSRTRRPFLSTAQKRGPGSVPRNSSQSCREGRAEAGNETGRGLRPLPRRTRMAARRSFGSKSPSPQRFPPLRARLLAADPIAGSGGFRPGNPEQAHGPGPDRRALDPPELKERADRTKRSRSLARRRQKASAQFRGPARLRCSGKYLA
jgi:hypothetical protein